jgi:hypothetical protein
MDFIVGLPKSQGFAHVLSLKHPFTAASIAQIFLDNIIKLHSFPKTIVSHRDPVFTSAFWTELFKRSDTKLNLSTTYHSQSDGQAEIVNQCWKYS